MSTLLSIFAVLFGILIALLIGLLLLICLIAVPYTIVHRLRLGCKFLLKERWEHWYVRRAVDAGLIGFFCLVGTWLIFSPTSACLENEIARALSLSNPRIDFLLRYHDGAAEKLVDSVLQLQSLEFFLTHFFQFVILPSSIVGFAGYSLERQKNQHQKTSLLLGTSKSGTAQIVCFENKSARLEPAGPSTRSSTKSD